LETNEISPENFFLLRKGSGFIKFLPQNNPLQPLSPNDVEIVRSIVKYGTVIPVVHVAFDVNDRIQLLDGPCKDMSAKVIAVNRRNKRVNIDVEFMNGTRVLGLTYEEVRKVEPEDK
jgi:transcriptional antiterminator NusG